LAHLADVFVFYDEVQYTKNDWRNRNIICGKNGLQWLSIPVEKQFVHAKISEVKIGNDWQGKHFKSLYLTYKSAPCFYQLEELMIEFLVDIKWEYLSTLNQFLITRIAHLIGTKTQFVNSAQYDLAGDKVEKLLGLIEQLGASDYISGPAGMNYLSGSETLFDQRKVKLSYCTYPDFKKYPQLIQPFQNNVSIVDLIAHVPYSEIKNYIWEGNT